MRCQAVKVFFKAIALTVFLVAYIVFLNNSAGQISNIIAVEDEFCVSFSSNKAVLYDESGNEKTIIDIHSPGFTGVKEVNAEYIVIYDARASKLSKYSHSGEYLSSQASTPNEQVCLKPQTHQTALANGANVNYSYCFGYEKVELQKNGISHTVFAGFSPVFPFYMTLGLIWLLIFIGFVKYLFIKR